MAASAENDCGCTNISIMQLFHELKQKFPAVPDRVVSECIRQNFHDKGTCEAILCRENASYLLHSYPPSLKMSSSEPEGSLSTKLQHLTICDKCVVDRPSCASHGSSGNQLCESAPFNRNLNVTGAQFLQEESSRLVQSLNKQVSPSNNYGSFPHTSDTFRCQENSMQRSDNRWQYQQVDKNVNPVQSVSSKSQVFEEGSSSSSVHSNASDFHNARWFTDFEPPVLPCGGNNAHNLTTHKSCNRLSSLKVDQSHFQPSQQTNSAPVISNKFEPFHSNNNVLRSSSVHGGDYSHSVGNHQNDRPNSESNRNAHAGNIPTDTLQEEEEEESVIDDHTVVNSYQVNVNCSLHGGRSSSTVNVSGKSTHTVTDNRESHQRARSAIHLQPAPHYAGHNIWEGDTAQTARSVSSFPQQPRSYTSVNLTLRPPSSEPQPPVSVYSGGSSLTYSTSSYVPNQGFQSKLQISIGPGGAGSVSAMRTQVREPTRVSQTKPQITQFVPMQEGLHEEPVCEPYRPAIPESSRLVALEPSRSSVLEPSRPLVLEPGRLIVPEQSRPVVPEHSRPVVCLPEPSRPVCSLAESTIESTTSSESTFQEHLAVQMDHLQVATQELLRQQLERKNRLQQELRREKEKLRSMRRSVRGMEKDLAQRQLAKNKALPAVTTVVQKVQRLKQEIRTLTEECEKMAHEVDNCSDPRVPLGETDEEFYKNIYTGQRGFVGSAHPSSRRAPPYRPDPLRQDSPQDSDGREGRSWTCSECTFRNYWELKYCEQCDMPRIMLGTDPSINTCYCHPPASKPHPPNPLLTIPNMCSTSPPKLN